MFKDIQEFMPGESASNKHYRAIFISDLHLGTPGCQAEALLEFLKTHTCDTLYLVGDIIDGWQLRRKGYWPQAHNEFARDFLDHSFGGIEVVEHAVHITADGKKMWVIHGDYFDGVIQFAKWLAYVGDTLYEMALKANRHLNYMRGRLGLPYWSLSAYLKHKVKKAVNFISDFEVAVAREARKLGYDGVVCGHIHHAEIREIEGVLYCNDGDWVESLTTLVEHHDGRLEVLSFDPYSEVKIIPKTTSLVTA